MRYVCSARSRRGQAGVTTVVGQLRDKIAASYGEEDRLIIACPTIDQLLVAMAAV